MDQGGHRPGEEVGILGDVQVVNQLYLPRLDRLGPEPPAVAPNQAERTSRGGAGRVSQTRERQVPDPLGGQTMRRAPVGQADLIGGRPPGRLLDRLIFPSDSDRIKAVGGGVG